MQAFLPLFSAFVAICTSHADCPSLRERSPFCMKEFEISEKQTSVGNEFEFRGVCSLDGECLFSLFNRVSNGRCWLKLGENSGGIYVKKYDKSQQTLELTLADGTVRCVQLSRSEPKSSPVRLARDRNVAMPVSEDARRKFLEIVRSGEK
jgi:hypothetical protein